MKQILCTILTVLLFVPSHAQEVEFNDNRALELKEVVEQQGMAKNEIFISAQSMLSDWLPNINSSIVTDMSDMETGTIIAKVKLYLGYKKANPMCGYNNYADVNLMIRCKDDRYQVVIKVPTLTLAWSAENNPAVESIAVEHVYPEYDGTKTRLHYTKNSLKEFGPQIPDNMISLFNAIKSKIKKLDDF